MVQLISNHCFNEFYFDIALDMKFILKNYNFYLLFCLLESTHAKCKIHACAKFLKLSRFNIVSLQCMRDVAVVKKKWQDLQSSVKKKECERRKYLGHTVGRTCPLGDDEVLGKESLVMPLTLHNLFRFTTCFWEGILCAVLEQLSCENKCRSAVNVDVYIYLQFCDISHEYFLSITFGLLYVHVQFDGVFWGHINICKYSWFLQWWILAETWTWEHQRTFPHSFVFLCCLDCVSWEE